MRNRVALDIIVPYFGLRELLEQMVTSVLAQTRGDWRLVIVEDGDQGQGVGTWLSRLQDGRIEHIVNSRNIGVAANFQRCLDLSAAEYVCFPGCDDRLLPGYVEQVLAAAQTAPTAAAVLPAVRVIDHQGRPARGAADMIKALLRPQGRAIVSGESLLGSLCQGNWTYFPATCWRRAPIAELGFRQDLQIALDLALLADLVLRGELFVLTDEPSFEYRRHRESASSRSRFDASRFDEERRLYEEIRAAAAQRGWYRAAWHAQLRLTSRLNFATTVPGRLQHPAAAVARWKRLGRREH